METHQKVYCQEEIDFMKIAIAVCDDDISMTSEIERILYIIADKINLEIRVDVFFDGQTLIQYLKNESLSYDLIYLDIEMKVMNGLQAAKIIREDQQTTILIFVSSHDSYLKELLEVEPFRFIDKPIEEKKFELYFMDALRKIKTGNEFFVFKYQKEFFKVKYKEIICFESEKRIINVMTKTSTYQLYAKLNQIEKVIIEENQDFLRIHQSYLVNLLYIRKVTYSYVELENGQVLKISEDRQPLVRKSYCQIMGGGNLGDYIY